MVFVMVLVAVSIISSGCGNKSPEQSVSEPVQVSQAQAPASAQPSVDVKQEVKAAQTAVKPAQPVSQSGDSLLVADFDAGEKPNNIGGNFGAWDKDPSDLTQGCAEAFDINNKAGDKGFGMKIDYDVDSTNPAYNGFWMFLQNLDASMYNNLEFDVKGDQTAGFTIVFKVELKNPNEVGKYYVTGITDQWQTIKIPLKELRGISQFNDLTEFVIVFEDRIASNKDGVIYIDNIRFTK